MFQQPQFVGRNSCAPPQFAARPSRSIHFIRSSCWTGLGRLIINRGITLVTTVPCKQYPKSLFIHLSQYLLQYHAWHCIASHEYCSNMNLFHPSLDTWTNSGDTDPCWTNSINVLFIFSTTVQCTVLTRRTVPSSHVTSKHRFPLPFFFACGSDRSNI
jgi:hypothetical protein